MSHLNVEIKARCSDSERIRQILISKNADFHGKDHQIDMYFNVQRGRLKLREGDIENYLIYYERKDKEGPKESHVTLFPTTPRTSLKEILEKSLGVLVVVDKKREIYFIENVKFHIDEVAELGAFVEIEAIDKDGSIEKEKLQEQCQLYMQLFGISDTDLVSVSYSDLLLKK
ncbi:MAG: class IV adenylate cyclase [bacterium]|nr:class IV adenylate cyclase [bacterium]